MTRETSSVVVEDVVYEWEQDSPPVWLANETFRRVGHWIIHETSYTLKPMEMGEKPTRYHVMVRWVWKAQIRHNHLTKIIERYTKMSWKGWLKWLFIRFTVARRKPPHEQGGR